MRRATLYSCALLSGFTCLILLAACASDSALNEPRPTVPIVTGHPSEPTINGSTTAPRNNTNTDRLTDPTSPSDPAPESTQPGPGTQPGQTGQTNPSTQTTQPGPNTQTTQPGQTSPSALADGNIADANIAIAQVLVLDEPIDMTIANDDPMAWIAQRGGQVLRVDLSQGEVVEEILDISTETVARGEQGLLGIAVQDGWLYVNFTDRNGHTRIDAFQREGTGINDTRRTILSQEQPFPNHNGGALAFGPDANLYIGFGDGGSANDPLNSGQDLNSWLGSILRIKPTPTASEPYAIPPDNPYLTDEGVPEIFISGVRNPWRFTFDKATHDLWIADVGQNLYEEVTVLLAANGGGVGANLGWRLREGLHEFSGAKPPNHVDPVWEYGRDQGCSVTGGYVYRGRAIPELVGSYVFGDYCSSRIWAVQISSGEVEFRDFAVAVPGGELAAFGQDANGELYTLSLSGAVSKIVPQ